MYSATEAGTAFTTLVTQASTVLTDNIGLVLGIVGALIGLGFVIRFVKKHVGRKA